MSFLHDPKAKLLSDAKIMEHLNGLDHLYIELNQDDLFDKDGNHLVLNDEITLEDGKKQIVTSKYMYQNAVSGDPLLIQYQDDDNPEIKITAINVFSSYEDAALSVRLTPYNNKGPNKSPYIGVIDKGYLMSCYLNNVQRKFQVNAVAIDGMKLVVWDGEMPNLIMQTENFHTRRYFNDYDMNIAMGRDYWTMDLKEYQRMHKLMNKANHVPELEWFVEDTLLCDTEVRTLWFKMITHMENIYLISENQFKRENTTVSIRNENDEELDVLPLYTSKKLAEKYAKEMNMYVMEFERDVILDLLEEQKQRSGDCIVFIDCVPSGDEINIGDLIIADFSDLLD